MNKGKATHLEIARKGKQMKEDMERQKSQTKKTNVSKVSSDTIIENAVVSQNLNHNHQSHPQLAINTPNQEEDSESSDEEDDEKDEEFLGWGKKSNYYSGDTADLEIGQDHLDAEDEEEAAKVAFFSYFFYIIF